LVTKYIATQPPTITNGIDKLENADDDFEIKLLAILLCVFII
jgi:hypothetical protein